MFQKSHIRYFLALIAFTILVLWGCSTQNTKWGNVKYHNISTHYNIWWNGNESLKEGIIEHNKKVKDDYTQILPVYKLGTKADAMSVYPQMDRAIEKGIKGVKKHSILVNGQEHVDYIKKCYLLTAYGSFYKQDYVSTANTCNLIVNQYSGTSEADEAAVLAARCLSRDNQFADAESELELLVTKATKGNFSTNQLDKLYMAMVESVLPQEKYKKSVQYIKLAIEHCHDNTTKARLYFIMAQIYQKLDKRVTATKYYDKVLSYSTDYVMEFNAKINIASCANLENSDLSKLERTLDKMLTDKKNEEYKDQIYYAKGEMYIGVKDALKACDNFKLSTATAAAGSSQKAKSALRLGEVLYEVYENYDLSQTYYDTAMSIIKNDYPHYSEIKSRYDMLTLLVSYTRVVHRNDSLIALADMSDADREAFIKNKIEEVKKQEEAAKEQELLAQFAADAKAQLNTLSGDWYFYNSNTVLKGKEQFKSRWGMRPLEDYWFLSQKSTMGLGLIAGLDNESSDDTSETADAEDADSTQTESSKKATDNPNDPHCKAYYLKDMPTSEQQRDSMNMQTAVCLLNAGYVYYEGLHNTPRALECYLRLATDYTDYDDIVQAFYQLYKIYDKQGNTPNSNYYRDMILMGFPDSDFANMIRDEEYYKEIINRSQIINKEYEDLYTMFKRRKYSDVIVAAEDAEEHYPNNTAVAKFSYWKGMALSRQNKTPQAISVFESIINKYPATDSIIPLAQAQLDYLKGGNTSYSNDETIAENSTEQEVKKTETPKPTTTATTSTTEDKPLPAEAQLFRYRAKMQHYVIVIVNDKKIRASELQIQLSNFNSKYYSNQGYKTSLLTFTDSTQLITIHRFIDGEMATNYWQHLQQDESPLKAFSNNDYEVFPISTQNYTTFYNRKDLEAYRLFFEKYYLEK